MHYKSLLLIALLLPFGCAQNTENTSDAVVVEEEMTEEMPMTTSPDIVAVASETESLSTLVQAVQAAGLVETLQGDGPFTVFAPTNAAFEALPAGTLENLLKPENREQLRSILTYHVVSGKVMSTDLTDGMNAATVAGGDVMVNTTNGVRLNNAASVTTADVPASNGVVHIIDAVLMPPAM